MMLKQNLSITKLSWPSVRPSKTFLLATWLGLMLAALVSRSCHPLPDAHPAVLPQDLLIQIEEQMPTPTPHL